MGCPARYCLSPHIDICLNFHIVEGYKGKPIKNIDPLCLDRNSTKAKGLDNDGWLRSPEGNLKFWVPSDKGHGVQDMSLMTLPIAHPEHPVVLDCTKMVLGEEWVMVKVISKFCYHFFPKTDIGF